MNPNIRLKLAAMTAGYKLLEAEVIDSAGPENTVIVVTTAEADPIALISRLRRRKARGGYSVVRGLAPHDVAGNFSRAYALIKLHRRNYARIEMAFHPDVIAFVKRHLPLVVRSGHWTAVEQEDIRLFVRVGALLIASSLLLTRAAEDEKIPLRFFDLGAAPGLVGCMAGDQCLIGWTPNDANAEDAPPLEFASPPIGLLIALLPAETDLVPQAQLNPGRFFAVALTEFLVHATKVRRADRNLESATDHHRPPIKGIDPFSFS